MRMELTPDGKPVLHMWGELRARLKDGKLPVRAEVYRSFQRFILLPEDVDPQTVEAKFDDEHTLRIVMFKRPEERRKEIDIQGKEGTAEEQQEEEEERKRKTEVAAADPTVGVAKKETGRAPTAAL